MNKKRIWQTVVLDIRCWILLFLAIRLIGITHPPIDIHSWRQAFTNTVARNFLEVNSNLFFPRISTSGINEGVIASEFPIFNYLIYWVSNIFGHDHWYGRLINLLCSSLGVYFFYRLVKRFWKEDIAFSASLIFLVSIWFTYSRKVMPDTFSVALMLGGLFYAIQYVDKGKWFHWVLFVLLASLGGLSKIPSTVLLSLLFFAFISLDFKKSRRIALIIGSGISVFLIATWYFWWVPHLLESYGNQLFFPRPLGTGFKEVLEMWPATLKQFYFYGLRSYVAFGFFVIGIITLIPSLIKGKNKLIASAFLLATTVFLLFTFKTGEVFPLHTYYMIPYIPIMALMAAFGLHQFLPKKWAYFLLVVMVIEGFVNQQHELRLKKDKIHLVELEEKIVNPHIEKTAKIATSGWLDPSIMYFAHRTGWSLSKESLENEKYMAKIREEGCEYLLIYFKHFQKPLPYEIVHKDEYFALYKL